MNQIEPIIQSASMSRDHTVTGRCRLTDSFPNNQSAVSERGDTARLIDQGRFTKGPHHKII